MPLVTPNTADGRSAGVNLRWAARPRPGRLGSAMGTVRRFARPFVKLMGGRATDLPSSGDPRGFCTMPDPENVIVIRQWAPRATRGALHARPRSRARAARYRAAGQLGRPAPADDPDVENFPGYPRDHGAGHDEGLRDQAEGSWARLKTERSPRSTSPTEPGGLHSVWVDSPRTHPLR